jgi:hypothetical protein
MKKVLSFVCILAICIFTVSCVDKQKKFDELTSEICNNELGIYATTLYVSTEMIDSEYSSSYEQCKQIRDLFECFNHFGITDRVISKLNENDSLYNEASKLDIDASKLNDLKEFGDRIRNLFNGINDIENCNLSYQTNNLYDMKSYFEKIQSDFKNVSQEKMANVGKWILGGKTQSDFYDYINHRNY